MDHHCHIRLQLLSVSATPSERDSVKVVKVFLAARSAKVVVSRSVKSRRYQRWKSNKSALSLAMSMIFASVMRIKLRLGKIVPSAATFQVQRQEQPASPPFSGLECSSKNDDTISYTSTKLSKKYFGVTPDRVVRGTHRGVCPRLTDTTVICHCGSNSLVLCT